MSDKNELEKPTQEFHIKTTNPTRKGRSINLVEKKIYQLRELNTHLYPDLSMSYLI